MWVNTHDFILSFLSHRRGRTHNISIKSGVPHGTTDIRRGFRGFIDQLYYVWIVYVAVVPAICVALYTTAGGVSGGDAIGVSQTPAR